MRQIASDPLSSSEPELPVVGGLDDGALLDAWERASLLARPWRELALLEAASGESAERLARLPIGRRDGLLLELHRTTFGGELEAESSCPFCGERVELAIGIDRLIEGGARPAEVAEAVPEWAAGLRPTTSLDVAAALEAIDAGGDPETVLVTRALETPEGPGSADATPDAIAKRLAGLDPLADLVVALTCPSCGAAWSEPLDPGSFVFGRLDARARRILDEVDGLARVYGWSEAEILSLSSLRRTAYLELALS